MIKGIGYLCNILNLCNIHKSLKGNNKGDKHKTPLWCPQPCMYLLWCTAYVLFTIILAGTTIPSLLRCSHMVKNMRTKHKLSRNTPSHRMLPFLCRRIQIWMWWYRTGKQIPVEGLEPVWIVCSQGGIHLALLEDFTNPQTMIHRPGCEQFHKSANTWL